MNNVPVVCYGCGNAFNAMRITASLKCGRCGSDDLDLDDRQPHTAASPGTGWNQSRPDRLEGWAVQPPGNLPSPNPESGMKLTPNTGVCPACNGTGQDTRASGGGYNEIPCRYCHGTGQAASHATTPGGLNDGTTNAGPPVGGARWAEAGRRSSDPLGSADDYIRGTDPDYDNRSGEPRKADTRAREVSYRLTSDPYNRPHPNAPVPIQAACPECYKNKQYSRTQLVRDASDDAWWHCPNCGPLHNVDKDPSVNPFDPPQGFVPNRNMKTKLARFRKKTGKALPMYREVVKNNPGLTNRQALTLVRNALLKYPEGS